MRRIDKFLVFIAMFGFAWQLVQAFLDFDELFTGRPPPAWEMPRPPGPSVETPKPRRPPEGLRLLPPISAADPVVQIAPQEPRRPNQRSSGTAVAVGRDGAWLTARHVIDGCDRIHLRRGQSWDAASTVYADPGADIAVLRARGGGPLLAVSAGPLALGEEGYAYGFSGQGGPSSIYATVLGRARAVRGGSEVTPVVAWAERSISPPGERWIGGMSGGPIITPQGVVVGIMSSASHRRGRIFTVAPEVVGHAVRQSSLPFEPAGAEPVAPDPNTFDQVRATLMERRTVVQVLCSS